ncbi:hypothetical protein Golob_020869 [Gossypium lobatum]|uniref:Uncharacterized protein n=1 Tax=Gossypium lobatum TaxID=34289 RepID=A0A7J8LBQ0_9ROSI|nr:hypothetical protein [Gossypium lobatum]
MKSFIYFHLFISRNNFCIVNCCCFNFAGYLIPTILLVNCLKHSLG